MINASGLPALFAASTWTTGGYFEHDGHAKLLASLNGTWVPTTEPDGVHISEEDFDAIEAATPNQDGTLQIGNVPKVVAARPVNDVRWVVLNDPE